MRMIRIYEDQRELLIREHAEAYNKLQTVKEAGAKMSVKKINYMNELIDYLMFLDDRIEVLEIRINTIGIGY